MNAPAIARAQNTPESVAVTNRYGNAYVVSRMLTGAGKGIKVLGLSLAALIALISLAASKGEESLFLLGVPTAVLVAILFVLVGIFIAAQGEILKATLDTAVNSSPFLTDAQRAEVMSISKIRCDAYIDESNLGEATEQGVPDPLDSDLDGSVNAICPTCGCQTTELKSEHASIQRWFCHTCNRFFEIGT
jgi:hypothetical protein